MAISKEMIWRMRAGGDEANGGGYDGVNYPGGIDYTDQDAAQISLTDLTSSASTTATSATGGFTANMVGNVLRLGSATGGTAGYYVIASYVDTHTITLDRTSGTYTNGVCKVGGAWNGFVNVSNGGVGVSPSVPSPIIAGNTIMIRGGGTDDPSSPDYDYTSDMTGYWTAPNGNATEGYIKVIGYNGRPFINLNALLLYTINFWWFENFKFKNNSNNYTVNAVYGANNAFVNVYWDQNGIDQGMALAAIVRDSHFYNTGSTSAGSYPAIECGTYGGMIFNNLVENVRGPGIKATAMGNIHGNIVKECHATAYGAIHCQESNQGWMNTISNNTIYNNDGDGIAINSFVGLMCAQVFNNIIVNNGGYGINVSALGGLDWNDRTKPFMDYNNVYNNASGGYNNISAGANDTSIDPLFTDTGTLDFSISANL